MYIGIMTDRPDMDGKIPALFADANYLLIVDTDTGTVRTKYTRSGMTDRNFARKLIEHDCEAVLCGPIEMEPFLITVEPGPESAPIPLNAHPGQEFEYLLEGSLRVVVDRHEVVLAAGDSIYFDSGHPHGIQAIGGTPANSSSLESEQTPSRNTLITVARRGRSVEFSNDP